MSTCDLLRTVRGTALRGGATRRTSGPRGGPVGRADVVLGRLQREQRLQDRELALTVASAPPCHDPAVGQVELDRVLARGADRLELLTQAGIFRRDEIDDRDDGLAGLE